MLEIQIRNGEHQEKSNEVYAVNTGSRMADFDRRRGGLVTSAGSDLRSCGRVLWSARHIIHGTPP